MNQQAPQSDAAEPTPPDAADAGAPPSDRETDATLPTDGTHAIPASRGVSLARVAGWIFVILWPVWIWQTMRQIQDRRAASIARRLAADPLVGNIGAVLIVLSPLLAFFLAWAMLTRCTTTRARAMVIAIAMFLGAVAAYVGCVMMDKGFPIPK